MTSDVAVTIVVPTHNRVTALMRLLRALERQTPIDGGFEVVYTGLHQTPEMIAEAAVQEDVDAVGLSILSGAHMTLFPEVIKLLKQRGAGDVAVFGGGIIPDDDATRLKQLGVREIFTPGASTEDIVKWVRENVQARQ